MTKGFRIFKGATQGAVMAGNGEYKIASSNSIAYGPDISTRFAFTAMELEDIMIPK
ncbi:hypothetical protein AGMMS50239_23260 [Bacteroidia bacterium]|nr:hypothetical protein AGMMS50239_23260 [Bacteroidia bacterium]